MAATYGYDFRWVNQEPDQEFKGNLGERDFEILKSSDIFLGCKR